MNNSTMTIYAQALSANRNYKNAVIDGRTVGIVESRTWRTAMLALRHSAYKVAVERHAHMGDNAVAAPVDMTKFYADIVAILNLIGEVNGAKLHASNIAESIVATAIRLRAIDVTPEMAHARYEKKSAKDARDAEENDETRKAYEDACAEVIRLESIAGNCKKIFEIQTESAFVKAVEALLGDAINKQAMKSLDEVLAEEEAKRQARRAKTAEKKKAKKAQAEQEKA